MVTRPTTVATGRVEQAVLKTPSVSNAWQLGTLLKAMALSDSTNGAVKLQIGARVVTAQTSLPLQAGQTLRLQVAEIGRTVVLRSVDGAPQNDSIRAAIRQNLPRQLAQTPLLSAAISLQDSGTRLPKELIAAADRLVLAAREAGTLTQGQGLRLAIRDSGVFLERKLAEQLAGQNRPQDAAMPRDWKAALLRFRNMLTQFQTKLSADSGTKQPSQTMTGGSTTRAAGATNASNAAASTGPSMTAAVARGAPAPVATSIAPIRSGVPGAQVPVAANALPGQAGPALALATALTSAGAQSANVVPATSVADANQTVVVKNVPPPMRHVLPQPQPLVQQSYLPTEALSLVSELIDRSDGALARVRLNQLASITPEQGSRLVWLLELPVRHADNRAEVVTVRIESEEETSEGRPKTAWTADLAFDLGARGELRARVALRAGRVSVSFWADEAPVRADVNAKLPKLKSAMEKRQLDVATLSAGAGPPSAPPVPSAALLETSA